MELGFFCSRTLLMIENFNFLNISPIKITVKNSARERLKGPLELERAMKSDCFAGISNIFKRRDVKNARY